jgi:hypothetical protein
MIASAWNETELLALFARVCDGLAEPAEMEQLDNRLTADARARQLWLEYVGVHGGVAQHLDSTALLVDLARAVAGDGQKLTDDQGAPRGSLSDTAQRTSRLAAIVQGVARWARRYPVISCTAALIVVSLGVALLAVVNLPERRRIGGGTEPPQFVAQLTDVVQPVWAEGQIGGSAGSHLQAGHAYRLQAGIAEITFRSGAKVLLEGPASLDIVSNNSCRLHHGKLAANVPPQARGFAIDTLGGRVTDLGTRFAVEVASRDKLTVHCFRGEVTFATPQQRPWRLVAGEAIEKSPAGVRKIVADAHAFIHDLRFDGELLNGARGLIVDKRFTNNVALGKLVTQSSTQSPYHAELAVDGNPANFTHTTVSDADPWLMVDLGKVHDIDAVILHNRDDCCGHRLRNVVVEVLGEDGQTASFVSPTLNADNQLNSPTIIAVGMPELTGDVVGGRYVRVRRIPSLGESDGQVQLADLQVLSLGEVQIFANPAVDEPKNSSPVHTILNAQ